MHNTLQKDESSARDRGSVGCAVHRPPLPPVSSPAWLCAGTQHGGYKYVYVVMIVGNIVGGEGCKWVQSFE